MDRKQLLAASLRVLTGRLDGRRPALVDIDLLRRSATQAERDYDLEDLACSIIQRITHAVRLARQSAIPEG